MSEPLEGTAAKMARESKEALHKIMDKVNDTQQLIVICKDLTGAAPTHIHIQGPSKDKVLLYGMLEVAKDVVQMSGK